MSATFAFVTYAASMGCWGGPVYDLTVGALFTFLFVHGLAAPLFRTHRYQSEVRAEVSVLSLTCVLEPWALT